jgi:hypothetical protein
MTSQRQVTWNTNGRTVIRHHLRVPGLHELELAKASAGTLRREFYRVRQMVTLDRANASIGVLIAVLALVYAGSALESWALRARTAPVIQVEVRAGDTLWGIASRYGNPDEYILRRVQRLAARNHIAPGTSLGPGMRLSVPVENPAEQVRLMSASVK